MIPSRLKSLLLTFFFFVLEKKKSNKRYERAKVLLTPITKEALPYLIDRSTASAYDLVVQYHEAPETSRSSVPPPNNYDDIAFGNDDGDGDDEAVEGVDADEEVDELGGKEECAEIVNGMLLDSNEAAENDDENHEVNE